MNLSIIILTKNEQEMIGQCLDALKNLNALEILIIDDNSTDQTVEIARKKGAKVLIHKKKDFSEARNFVLKQAKGDWILYIDADEVVSEELAKEINQVTTYNSVKDYKNYAAYSLTRVNYYLGKRWPKTEQVIRLFRKKDLKGWIGKLHESPQVSGKVGKLNEELLHFTHRSLSEMVENTIVWSEIEAKLRYDAGHPKISWWRIPRVMLPVFFDYYVSQDGWKVGTVGLIESIYQAFSIFITYARVWEMQQKKL